MDATEDQLITEEDSGHPLKALPEQEIHKAVFDCKPDKIPGPDGFQRNLFQSGTSSNPKGLIPAAQRPITYSFLNNDRRLSFVHNGWEMPYWNKNEGRSYTRTR